MTVPEEKNNEDILELYHIYREQVVHENNLYNNRITWLLTLNGFLFAGIGFLVQFQLNQENDRNQYLALMIGVGTCFLGIYLSAISNNVLSHCRKVLDKLRTDWKTLQKQDQRIINLGPYFPHPSGGDGTLQATGIYRSAYIPRALIVNWLWILSGLIYEIWQQTEPVR